MLYRIYLPHYGLDNGETISVVTWGKNDYALDGTSDSSRNPRTHFSTSSMVMSVSLQ